jgi:hypothetical protein
MTKAEIEYESEIERLKEAVAKTQSNYLKRDYGKKISRMQKELKEYRSYIYR